MYYFAYGSNMNFDQMKKRCPDAIFVGTAELKDYQLGFRFKSTGYDRGAADIVSSRGDTVHGGVYWLTQSDFENLDKYEDVAINDYQRVEVKVKMGKRLLKALSYEVCDKSPEDLNPTEEYLNLIIEGAKNISLPDSYIKEIRERLS